MEVVNIRPRMRTLDECYKELIDLDPQTSVSKYFIRRLALSGAIPCVMSGRKRLINFDRLLEYLNKDNREQNTLFNNGIRSVH